MKVKKGDKLPVTKQGADSSQKELKPPIAPGGKPRKRISGPHRSDNRKKFITVKNQKNISEESEEEKVHREEVDNAAISFVLDELKKEEKSGWEVEDMNVGTPNNKGYDIKFENTETKEVRYIEVKGLSGPWHEGAAMTDVQFHFSLEHREQSWLYVVEHALDAPKLFKIKNPAAVANRFVFDHGWKELSEDGQVTENQEKGADVLRSAMNKKNHGKD